jgi:6-phosphofructokinase 1
VRAGEVEARTGVETRVTVLGQVQRGGTPPPPDPILATPNRRKAADHLDEEQWGPMAAHNGDDVVAVPLKDAVAELKTVPPEFYEAAKIFFG